MSQPLDQRCDIPSLKLNREMEALAWQARAHIVWGKPPEEVREEMLRCGADEETAQRVLYVCLKERDASVRRRGWRSLSIGLVLIAGCTLVIETVIRNEVNLGVRILALPIAGFCFGVFFVLRGVERTLFASSVQEPDVDEEPWGP